MQSIVRGWDLPALPALVSGWEICRMEVLRAQDPLYQAPETETYILPECPVNCDIGVHGFDSSRANHIAS